MNLNLFFAMLDGLLVPAFITNRMVMEKPQGSADSALRYRAGGC